MIGINNLDVESALIKLFQVWRKHRIGLRKLMHDNVLPGEVIFLFASFHPNDMITHQNVTMSELIKKFPKGHISILLYLIK